MEKWTRWEPIQGLEGKYYLESFVWPEEGVTIGLINEDKGKKIQIVFDGHIDAFRYTNESFYLKILDNASPQDDINFYKDFSLFKVINSEYLAWISEKSCTWSDQLPFMHFCILGGDEVIDVLARYEPKVTIMDYKPEVTIYSRKEFGLELKAKIKNKEDIARIGRWVFDIYCENLHDIDDNFRKLLKGNNRKCKNFKYFYSIQFLHFTFYSVMLAFV